MRDSLNSSKHQGHEGHTVRAANTDGTPVRDGKGFYFESFVPFVFKVFTPENIWAFVLFLIAVALIIFTTDSSPVWIYQGF